MDSMIKRLKSEGFSKSQLDEIKLGIEAGIDVSVYAQKDLIALQMQQIRLGMMEG